jgi:hypothetical protein
MKRTAIEKTRSCIATRVKFAVLGRQNWRPSNARKCHELKSDVYDFGWGRPAVYAAHATNTKAVER